jgi:epsilon-lactone hydrolase
MVSALLAFSTCALSAQKTAQQPACKAGCIAQTNSTYIDAAGTAHVTRVVSVPPTVSLEAQKFLARQIKDIPGQGSALNYWEDQDRAAKIFPKLYPVQLSRETIAGVPVKIVTPLDIPEQNRSRVLINVHGGGFVGDGGSWTESIPIGYLSRTKVVSVLYRLAPQHPFPAAVDDTVAVYKELLKTYRPENIGLYGTSAGAMLAPEVCVKLRQLGLPLPGALGIFGGQGDFTTAATADSRSLYTQDGLAGHLDLPPTDDALKAYAGNTNLRNPVLSPMYADLHGFPPTLFLTSTRDMMLSGTTILHRAFLRSGVDARLVVFEGLPHGFWYDPYLPESKEAYEIMVSFFAQNLHLAEKTSSYAWK